MPRQLTTHDRLARLRRGLAQVSVVAASFAGGGLVAGWVWERVWTPPVGIAVKGRFAVIGEATGREFEATGSYVVVALAMGLLVGVCVALVVRGGEVTTLLASAVAAVGAGWLMAQLGHRLGPPDPQAAAKSVVDWTELPLDLRVTGLSPYAAFPFGAALGVAVGLLVLSLVAVARSSSRDVADG